MGYHILMSANKVVNLFWQKDYCHHLLHIEHLNLTRHYLVLRFIL